MGAPEGCVSSTVLFKWFTNECSASHAHNDIFKYSDSAVLNLHQVHDSTNVYHSALERFVEWLQLHKSSPKSTLVSTYTEL